MSVYQAGLAGLGGAGPSSSAPMMRAAAPAARRDEGGGGRFVPFVVGLAAGYGLHALAAYARRRTSELDELAAARAKRNGGG